MSRTISRLMLVASLAAGFGLAPTVGARAAGAGIDASNNQFGIGDTAGFKPSTSFDVAVHDDVSWRILDGTHTVTPVDENQWGQKGSGELHPDDKNPYRYTWSHADTVGKYYFYCKIHGHLPANPGDEPTGMWGVINVVDPNAPADPPATSPPATSPPATSPPATQPRPVTPPATTPPPATAAGAGHGPATAPTTAAPAKPEKDKKPKDETTTTTAPPPAPVDLPDSAIVPTLPGATPLAAPVGNPGEAPQGDASANLPGRGKGHGGDGMKLLILTGVGIGALGIGGAGWKFSQRSSKYWPA